MSFFVIPIKRYRTQVCYNVIRYTSNMYLQRWYNRIIHNTGELTLKRRRRWETGVPIYSFWKGFYAIDLKLHSRLNPLHRFSKGERGLASRKHMRARSYQLYRARVNVHVFSTKLHLPLSGSLSWFVDWLLVQPITPEISPRSGTQWEGLVFPYFF